jgi:cell division protein ZapA (FtsZ GTPase activity inhibitor)
MSKNAVEVVIAGHSYRLVTSLDPVTLKRLANEVDTRIAKLAEGQQLHPKALLLVALGLAHELEEERARCQSLSTRSQAMLRQLLERVDDALGSVDENAEPLASVDELRSRD